MFLLPSKTPRRRSRSTRCMMNSERQQSCWSRRLCFVSDKSAGAYRFPENPVVVIASPLKALMDVDQVAILGLLLEKAQKSILLS